MFPDFKMFCSVMDQCTENYECLVIDNSVKSNKIEDLVFCIKQIHENLRLGSQVFWNIKRYPQKNKMMMIFHQIKERTEKWIYGSKLT